MNQVLLIKNLNNIIKVLSDSSSYQEFNPITGLWELHLSQQDYDALPSYIKDGSLEQELKQKSLI